MTSEKLAGLVLRLGIGFAFIYAAISAFVLPDAWIGYFPSFMRGIVSDSVLLGSFAVFEIVLGLWIISGKRIFWPSFIAGLMLLGIVLFNFSQFLTLFRDVALAAAAFSLALSNYRARTA